MAGEMSLKLLIDSKAGKVLFAEAGKDVVDFLFSLLAMPVGAIIKLLTKEKMVGSMGCIYSSIEGLDDTYMEQNQTKSMLLSPTTSRKNTLFLIEDSPATTAKKYYGCSFNGYGDCKTYYTDVYGTSCARCDRQMTSEMHYVGPKSGTKVSAAAAIGESGGFVKGVVTYTVMDDLTVTPMSAISSITLLNKFNIKDLSSLQERTVTLGMKEGLELLRVSLQSNTVLTDLFLGENAARAA